MDQSEQPQVLDLQKARAQIQKLLPKDEDLAQRAEEILVKIISKNARVYETDRASIGLPAVAAYLACEEVESRKITQRVCQTESKLGPKLFRRALELCRAAKNLDESKINFVYLSQRFNGSKALPYMPRVYTHFKDSCFDAGIVDQTLWDANHILVICAIFCFCCDNVAHCEGELPSYNGHEVSFACGLSWENVQKSMYFNLNPHCLDRMQHWLKEHNVLHEQGGPSNGDMPPPSGSQLPAAVSRVVSPGHPPPTLEGSKNIPNAQLSPPVTISFPSQAKASHKSRANEIERIPPPRLPPKMVMEDVQSKPSNGAEERKRTRRKDRLGFTKDEWVDRPMSDLLIASPNESIPDSEVRVYYAWKRMIRDGEKGNGKHYAPGVMRDFVMT